MKIKRIKPTNTVKRINAGSLTIRASSARLGKARFSIKKKEAIRRQRLGLVQRLTARELLGF